MTQTSPQVNQNTAIARAREIQDRHVQHFSEVARECSSAYLEATRNSDDLATSFVAARSMQDLRQAFTPEILNMVRPLMNSQMGFKTDRPPGATNSKGKELKPYSDAVLADCCIAAAMRGVQFMGNQFNIIAGQAYITKEGFEYLIKKFPGFQWWKIDIGTAKTLEGGYLVPVEGEWCVSGCVDSAKAEIQVRKDSFSTIDQAKGKAKRKFYQVVFERITGRKNFEPEDTEAEIIENEATQDNGRGTAPGPQRPAPEPAGATSGKEGQNPQRHGDGVSPSGRENVGGTAQRQGDLLGDTGRGASRMGTAQSGANPGGPSGNRQSNVRQADPGRGGQVQARPGGH